MYEINRTEAKEYYDWYIYRAKNYKNQTIVFEIYKTVSEKIENIHWYITFYIAQKRKHGFQQFKSTGKDGIKSLIWAKKCLIDFIEFIKETHKDEYIIIYYDGNKRRNVYLYGLKSLGFYLSKFDNRNCLMLKIK